MHVRMLLQRCCFGLALQLLCGGIGTAALAEEGRLRLPQNPLDPIMFLDAWAGEQTQDPGDLFQVFVGQRDQCCEGRTPIVGTYTEIDGGWSFAPLYELLDGQAYVARTATPSGVELTEFSVAENGQDGSPVVTAIYPAGQTIPENTLRFYVHFSEPMKPHVASEFIKLVDATGNVDAAAFMQFKQELWSADRRRLTVLMDPGRIKRGVAQNLSLGPALEKGQRYSFVVEAGWPAAASNTTLERFEQSFRVSAPLRTVPDIAAWRIVEPSIGSRDPIRITFNRPFDSAQLQSEIEVFSPGGRVVPGRIFVAEGEEDWTFTPDRVWEGNHFTLVINTSLEDVAGNNFRELLDHAVGAEEKNIGDLSLVVKLTEPHSDN